MASKTQKRIKKFETELTIKEEEAWRVIGNSESCRLLLIILREYCGDAPDVLPTVGPTNEVMETIGKMQVGRWFTGKLMTHCPEGYKKMISEEVNLIKQELNNG